MSKQAKLGIIVAALVLVGVVGAELVASLQRPAQKHVITGKDLKGQSWDLAEHLGKRPVVVNFFATWCGPCRIELPHLIEMQQKYADRGLQLVLLSEEDIPTLKGAGADQIPVPVLPGMKQAFQRYEVAGIPRTLYFSRDGRLARDLEGLDEAGLKEIEKELAGLPVVAAR